jgi:antitoxin (DNA-binding transcriptional repressor) of toxin-antitoxin stability system
MEQVESGKEPEVIIARNGNPAARLVRLGTEAIGKRIGVAKGCFEVPDSIDADNEEIAKLFSGSTP